MSDTISNTRPSPEIRKDRGERYREECERNRQHIRKTIALNMRLADEQYQLSRQGSQPQRFAAECYAMRAFVVGIIEGRGYALPEAEREALKREWEEMWDKTFGDYIGQTLSLTHLV